MKSYNLLLIIFASVCGALAFSLAFTLLWKGSTHNEKILFSQEYSYFKGFKDAVEGRQTLETTTDGCYYWVKSPWNSNRVPTFQPMDSCHTFNQ
jgi:hypothetical protein